MSTKARKTPAIKRGTTIVKRTRAKSAKTRDVAADAKVRKAAKRTGASKPATDGKSSKVPKTLPASAPKPSRRPRVRVSFAMPEADYARIASLKALAKRSGYKVKKNELVRLGLRSLQALDETELQARVFALRDGDATVVDG